MNLSISLGGSPVAEYGLVVFEDPWAAPELVGSGVSPPLALLLRLDTGRLIEIDLGLKHAGMEVSEGDRDLLPSSSSALVMRDTDSEELDELLERWDHVVHSLSNQNPTRPGAT